MFTHSLNNFNIKIHSPFFIGLFTLIFLAACTALPLSAAQSTTAPPSSTPPPSALPTSPSPTPFPTLVSCTLQPVARPTLPAVIPGYTEKDPNTGLHITGKYQVIDLASYRLHVTGKIDRPLDLSYDDLRCMPKITSAPNLICPGFFEDVATWAGTPFSYLLDLVGVQKGALMLRLESADGYSVMLPVENARAFENMLAYEWDGQPLPVLHGFPIRAIFPGMAGGKWIKWLVHIDVY